MLVSAVLSHHLWTCWKENVGQTAVGFIHGCLMLAWWCDAPVCPAGHEHSSKVKVVSGKKRSPWINVMLDRIETREGRKAEQRQSLCGARVFALIIYNREMQFSDIIAIKQ